VWVDQLGLNKRGPADTSKIDGDCQGKFRDHMGRFAADPGWPADQGFLGGKSDPIILQPREIIDRYGYPGGTFFPPVGTPFENRTLPSSYKNGKPYYIYEVQRPISLKPDILPHGLKHRVWECNTKFLKACRIY